MSLNIFENILLKPRNEICGNEIPKGKDEEVSIVAPTIAKPTAVAKDES